MRTILAAGMVILATTAGYAADIEQRLEERDYTNIRVIDGKGRATQVEACRDGRQFSLSVNREGDILKRSRHGWCSESSARKGSNERVASWRRINADELEGKKRLSGQDCQDLLTYATQETEILFKKESAELSDGARPMLQRIARIANRCSSAHMEIGGHTDSDGARDLNQALSERRAKAVAEFLVLEGVKLERLEPIGYGQDRPRSTDKALNRRIEFVLDWET
jgi:outer membrane protein OmpA-like peptidoglycan-associated protein